MKVYNNVLCQYDRGTKSTRRINKEKKYVDIFREVFTLDHSHVWEYMSVYGAHGNFIQFETLSTLNKKYG